MPGTSPTVGENIVRDPKIHSGEPVIAGTATTVRAVAEIWNTGVPAEEIPLHLAHLQLVQVFEALRFYLSHRDEIDQYIEANRIPAEWSGKRFDPASGTRK